MRQTIEISHGELNSMVLLSLKESCKAPTTYRSPYTVKDRDIGDYTAYRDKTIMVDFIVELDGKEYKVEKLKAIYNSDPENKS